MNELTPADISLRLLAPGDMALVSTSWLKSYWDGGPAKCPVIAPPIYKAHQRQLIETLLKRAQSTSVIAYPPGEPDTIIGYAIIEHDTVAGRVVHYVYVKEAFRRFGIATRLVGTESFTYTHLTQKACRIMQRRRDFSYNPWLLIQGRNNDQRESSGSVGVENSVPQWHLRGAQH